MQANASQDLSQENADDERDLSKTQPHAKQFMSLPVGPDGGTHLKIKRPTSSQMPPQGPSGASPAKNGSSSPVKLQRVKLMNQTAHGGGAFKLTIPQPPQAQAQVQSLQSINTDYTAQPLLSSHVGSSHILQSSHQRPPAPSYNTTGGQQHTQATGRMASPHLDLQSAKQREGLVAQKNQFHSIQPGQQHPQPSPTQKSNKIALMLQSNQAVGKLKIQSNSLNRIQQQSNARHSTEFPSRNQITLSGDAGTTSASGSRLCRPGRPQTNNLITAGATIMANSPHPADESASMPSIAGSQPHPKNTQPYRSSGRGDSCERTINNTIESFLNITNKSNNASQVANYQNFQAMQMAIHNGGQGRTRRACIAQGVIRVSEKKTKAQERVSLPVIGRVHATQDTRTGILTKTKSLMSKRRSSKMDLLSGEDEGQMQGGAGASATEPHSRRSGSRGRRLVQRVSSRYSEIGKELEVEDDYDGSDFESIDDEADQVAAQESRQRSALEQILLSEDSYPKGSTNTTSPTHHGEDAVHGGAPAPQMSVVNQLIQKEKESTPAVLTEAPTPKVVGGKVPQLAQDANVPKPKKGQPFDFNFIKILIKRGNSDKDKKEVFLDRHWVQKNNNVPHFANVISNVDGTEGVEITMNCNKAAFTWLMDFVRIKSNAADHIEQVVKENGYITQAQEELINDDMDRQLYVKMDEIDVENCLNILVTAYFLQLFWVYEKVWSYYFKRNFSEVINACSISLSNINPAIVRHIAERIGEDLMEEVQERKDKFLSNVYKEKINYHVHMEGGSEASKGTGAPPGLAEMDEVERQLLKESKQLYWCARCKNLLTKEQATRISCVEPPPLDDGGQPNCALGTNIFEFYKERVNPLCLAPSDIFKSMMMNEEQAKSTQPKRSKLEVSDNDDGFVDEAGLSLFHHDLVFEEDVPKILELMKKLPANQRRPIKVSVPIDLSAFIKFFREKYRLCWKEIYLKVHALVFRPEQCKKCRKWFQISHIATCPVKNLAGTATSDQLNPDFVPVTFHEIDHSEKELPMQNCLTLHDIKILKQEVQVLDNQKMQYRTTQRDREKNRKGKNQIEVLVEQMKDQIAFIEPQSMNFDVKMSDAYAELLRREEKSKGQGKQAADNKMHNTHDVQYTNGKRYEYADDQIDDDLYSSSKAQKRINKKLKDSKFMSKMQKECESYVRDNPDEFKKMEHSSKAKLDIVDNRILDLDANKKKSRKEQLDAVQTAEVQQLVIKRFRRCRKDIILEDDDEAMLGLQRALANVRTNETHANGSTRPRNASGAGTRQSSSNPKGAPTSALQPGKDPGFQLVRNRSPQGHAAQTRPEANSSNCDLAAQAGVKIYSDIKQITVKKAAGKKVPIITKNQDGPRKNILQRNFARSSGARSGSNQNKGNQNLIGESPVIPVLHNGAQQRNNSSNPKKPGSNSMVLVDDQKDGATMQTPKNDLGHNPKMRQIQQNNSATRVQAQRTGLSMEGVHLKLPANNFINQSQEQLKPNFDGHQPTQDKSLNQRRPLRSPGDQQALQNMVASQHSLDRGAASSGRGGQQLYTMAGSAYPAPMKLALPHGLNRSVVDINSGNPANIVNLQSIKPSQGPSRSGSHGPTSTAADSTATPASSHPSLAPASGTQPLRINKSPALKIRASKIDRAQTLLKLSQQKQNNQQS